MKRRTFLSTSGAAAALAGLGLTEAASSSGIKTYREDIRKQVEKNAHEDLWDRLRRELTPKAVIERMEKHRKFDWERNWTRAKFHGERDFNACQEGYDQPRMSLVEVLLERMEDQPLEHLSIGQNLDEVEDRSTGDIYCLAGSSYLHLFYGKGESSYALLLGRRDACSLWVPNRLSHGDMPPEPKVEDAAGHIHIIGPTVQCFLTDDNPVWINTPEDKLAPKTDIFGYRAEGG